MSNPPDPEPKPARPTRAPLVGRRTATPAGAQVSGPSGTSKSLPASSESATLSPSDHVRMLVELLQPLGPELVRRWFALLLLVDRDEREAMVEMMERRVVELYGSGSGSGSGPGSATTPEREITVAHPPRQRDGYVEQEFVTYVERAEPKPAPASKRTRRGGA